jgi:hypothetical protein
MKEISFSGTCHFGCQSNAMLYNPPEDFIHQAACRLSAALCGMVDSFKESQLQAAQKAFARASAKPNSAVAALIEQRNRLRFIRSLVPSSATLLVVPSVLMEHWQVSLGSRAILADLSSHLAIPHFAPPTVGPTSIVCGSDVLY